MSGFMTDEDRTMAKPTATGPPGEHRGDWSTYPVPPPPRYSLRERGVGCAAVLGTVTAIVVTTAFVIAVPQRGRWYEEFLGAAVLGGSFVLGIGFFVLVFRLVGWTKPPTPDNIVAGVVRVLVRALDRSDRLRRAPTLGPHRPAVEAFLDDNPGHPWSPEIRRLLAEVDRLGRERPRLPPLTRKERVLESLRGVRNFSKDHPVTSFATHALLLLFIVVLLVYGYALFLT